MWILSGLKHLRAPVVTQPSNLPVQQHQLSPSRVIKFEGPIYSCPVMSHWISTPVLFYFSYSLFCHHDRPYICPTSNFGCAVCKVIATLVSLLFAVPGLDWEKPSQHVEAFSGCMSVTKAEWEDPWYWCLCELWENQCFGHVLGIGLECFFKPQWLNYFHKCLLVHY
jgi:hypothetical protein